MSLTLSEDEGLWFVVAIDVVGMDIIWALRTFSCVWLQLHPCLIVADHIFVTVLGQVILESAEEKEQFVSIISQLQTKSTIY